MPSQDVQCKLVLIGNGSVGKSSIIRRFTTDGFQRSYKQTVGVDFFEKRIDVQGDGLRVNLQVWDVGGQSLSSTMLPKYFHGARLIFLCYDITDPQSFGDLEDWINAVHREFKCKPDGKPTSTPDIYLIGNKIDLIGLRQTTEASHNQFVKVHSLAGGFYCSALSGDNILRGFYTAVSRVVGVSLSSYELGFFDRPVGITVEAAQGETVEDGGRTPWADAIEAEDIALEAAKADRARKICLCM
ncbi:unnamed protein product [Discosporangium mesarthrocarpum]